MPLIHGTSFLTHQYCTIPLSFNPSLSEQAEISNMSKCPTFLSPKSTCHPSRRHLHHPLYIQLRPVQYPALSSISYEPAAIFTSSALASSIRIAKCILSCIISHRTSKDNTSKRAWNFAVQNKILTPCHQDETTVDGNAMENTDIIMCLSELLL